MLLGVTMKRRILCFTLAIILVFSAFAIRLSTNFSKAFEEYVDYGVKSHLKLKINQIISEQLDSYNMQIDEIATVERTFEGRIISICVNSILINKMILKIEEELLKGASYSSLELGIPFGNLLGYKIIAGKGPVIEVNALPISVTSQSPKSELLTSGINQTLHRITVVFETEINCIAPFHQTKCNVSTTLILSELLIVGEVPEIFFSPAG